ncbi:LysR family transcriptional regulator, partial [Staphylococcus haemolyticus]
MNFNDMSIFVTIYETRSINKSSKILQYAQSNLSARLKVLETELDTKLFYRKYNGLIPTESGDLFYQFCKETSNNLEKLKKKCETSKISILISELLFNHDINNSQTIDLDKSEINIQKTSDIPIIAHQEEFDKIFCFQKIENLKHY